MTNNSRRTKDEETTELTSKQRFAALLALQAQLKDESLSEEQRAPLKAAYDHELAQAGEQLRGGIKTVAKYAAIAALIIALGLGALYVYGNEDEDEQDEQDDFDSEESEEEDSQ